MARENYLAIGKIRTSFGVKGLVKVFSYSGEYDHFYALKEAELVNKRISERKKIESVSLHGSDLVIKFEGIDSPEAAKKYSEYEIWVPREAASRCGEGEYYISDLYGAKLIGSGEKKDNIYGTVKSVLCDTGTSDFLEIETIDNAEGKKKTFLVPFSGRFIGEVNLKDKTIELLEEWILQ